ncbi:snRNA-activating protein complex subunit 4 [Osmerus eperlanus]|uniref:snRNA-activating protein complex subunit 4 n=1 Tax=Osmerus eperlanus TaxID=29151 RepID=UPI002E0FA02A
MFEHKQIDDSDDNDASGSALDAEDLEGERERVQREIEELERSLGTDAIILSDEEDGGIAPEGSEEASEEELDLPQTAESCLQMNLVYQEVLREKMEELEKHLADNKQQQKELVAQMSGPGPSDGCAKNSIPNYNPNNLFMGHFLRPYFKDKLTALGPPANPETKEKNSKENRGAGMAKVKRWTGWQKALLVNSVVRDCMRLMIKPKLTKVEYLTEKISKTDSGAEKQNLRQQIDQLEKEIEEIRAKKEEELTGSRLDEHDWEKIANIDFEGLQDAENIKLFWQNCLHPSINKNIWKDKEIDKLRIVAHKNLCINWELIAEQLGTNRTGFMCLQAFQRYVSKTFKKGPWQPQDDQQLRDLTEKMRVGNFIPYTQMSYFMEGRPASQVMYRWTMVLDPSLKKGHWTPDEDQLLLKAVSKYGAGRWWKIKQDVPGRTDTQCRDRYLDCLREGVKKGPWSPEEMLLLKEMVKKHGEGKWAAISREIPNRLDSQCMTQWSKLKRHKSGLTKKQSRAMRKSVRKRIRKRLQKLEEEEEGSTSEEEDPTQIVYMDSDDETKGEKRKRGAVESETEEEVERLTYLIPPLEKWIPTWDPNARGSGTLNTVFVELPSVNSSQEVPDTSGLNHGQPSSSVHPSQDPPTHQNVMVRSTILDRFGNYLESVVGDNPAVLAKKDRHSLLAMLKVPFAEIKELMLWRGVCASRKRNSFRSGPVRTFHRPSSMTSNTSLHHALLVAVTPWVGNLLLPAPLTKNRPWKLDVVRERAEALELTSTPVFKFFLQALRVDTDGCKKIIQHRQNPQRMQLVPVQPVQNRQTTFQSTVANRLQQVRKIPGNSMTQQNSRQSAAPISSVFMGPSPVFITQPIVQGQRLPVQAHSLPVQGTRIPVRASPLPVPGVPMVRFVVAKGQKPVPLNTTLPGPLTSPSPHILCLQSPPIPSSSSNFNPLTCSANTLSTPTILRVPLQTNSFRSPPGRTIVAEISVSPKVSSPAVGKRARKPTEKVKALLEKGKRADGVSPRRKRTCKEAAPEPKALLKTDGKSPGFRKTCMQIAPKADPQTCSPTPWTITNEKPAPPPPLDINIVYSIAGQRSLRPKQPDSQQTPSTNAITNDHSSYTMSTNPGTALTQSYSPNLNPQTTITNSTATTTFSTNSGQAFALSTNPDPGLTPSTSLPAVCGLVQRVSQSSAVPVDSPQSPRCALNGSTQSQPGSGPTQSQPNPGPTSSVPMFFLQSNSTPWPHGLSPFSPLQQQFSPGPCRPYILHVQQPGTPGPGPVFRHPSPGTIPFLRQLSPGSGPFPMQQGHPGSRPILRQNPTTLIRHVSPGPQLFFRPVSPGMTVPLPTHTATPSLPSNVIIVDATEPSFKPEPLRFDPSLILTEEPAQVIEWLTGKTGVVLPKLEVALPYLPPFSSNLASLSALLRHKKSLTTSALQLLPPEEQGASEEEKVAAVREVIAERFGTNPAYLMLKARFLSCYTLPAFLATLNPVNVEADSRSNSPTLDNGEGEEQTDYRLSKRAKVRDGSTRMQSSLLVTDGTGAPAAHYSGIPCNQSHLQS